MQKPTPSFRQSVLWVLTERGAQMGLALLISVVLARVYGPEGFAMFQAYLSIATVWAAVGLICSAEVLIPRYASEDPRYGLIFEYAFLLRAAAALVAVLGYWYYVQHYVASDPWLALPLLAIVLFYEPFAAFGVYFQTIGAQRIWSRIRLFWLGLKVALVLLIAAWQLPLAWVAVPYAIEAMGAALWTARRYWYDAIRPMWSWQPALLRELLTHGAIMGIGLLAMVWLQKFDRLYLANAGDLELLGFYAAGMQIAESWFFCGFLLVQAIAGKYVFSLPAAQQLQRVGQISAGFVALATVGWLMSWWLAPWLMPLVYGATFAPAAVWLQWQLGLAILVWAEAGMGMTLLGRKASGLITLKWGGALALAFAVAQLDLQPPFGVPSPLHIPLAGYAFALSFSTLYWFWCRSRVV